MKLTVLKVIIIILTILGIKIYFKTNSSKYYKNQEEILLNESARVLNECFDLENKNKRTLNESIELIEYCSRKYGYKN